MEQDNEETVAVRCMTNKLVVLKILEHLGINELASCRLVNGLWNLCASTWLRERGKMVKLAQEDGLNSLSYFLPIVTNSEDPYFPFSRFKIDLSVSNDAYNKGLFTVLKIIKERPKIKKLKIIFDLPLHFCFDEEKVERIAMQREEFFPLSNLEQLAFVLTLFEGFDPAFANIESIIKSVGVKKLGIVITAFLNFKMVQNLSYIIFRIIFNPSVRTRTLQELMIRFEFLDESVLDILINWNHPLKSLDLSIIQLTSIRITNAERAYNTIQKLYEFLSLQKNTLQNLSLKFAMRDADAQIVISMIGLNRSIVNSPREQRRQPDIFPKLPELIQLTLSAIGSEVGIFWRLNSFNFSQKFPKLKRLFLKNWEISLQEDIPFLVENVSYPLIEQVQLPNTRQTEDCLIIPKILIAMPNVHTISFHFRPEVLEAIYRFPPEALKKITIFLSAQYQNLDPVLIGIPSMEDFDDWTWQQILNFPVHEYQLRPCLLSLKNLRELVINTESNQANITDITVVHVLMKLKYFCQLTVDTYPWNGISEWRISKQCQNYMKSKIQLKLTQNHRNKRYSQM